MLATQMLLVVMTIPWLTVAMGVRACFRKLIGKVKLTFAHATVLI
jgi:hypothetical protein